LPPQLAAADFIDHDFACLCWALVLASLNPFENARSFELRLSAMATASAFVLAVKRLSKTAVLPTRASAGTIRRCGASLRGFASVHKAVTAQVRPVTISRVRFR
jgi:hypothetical protein